MNGGHEREIDLLTAPKAVTMVTEKVIMEEYAAVSAKGE